MQVRSLGQEYPLEKGMATHSSILAWRMPWTEEPGGLQSIGSHRVRHDRSDLTHTSFCGVRAHVFFFKLNNIPLYGFPTVCLSIHLLKENCLLASFGNYE